MDSGLVIVTQSRFGRLFLAGLVLAGAAGATAGAVSEWHGPLRMAVLAGAGALAGWALAIFGWGASATAIRPATRALEVWSRWGSPRWRRVRGTPLPEAHRVVFTRESRRMSKGGTYVVFPFRLEGPGGPTPLDTALDEDEGWSRALTVASALGLALEDRRVTPPRVLPVSGLQLPPAPAQAPQPPPGSRMRHERGEGTFRAWLPASGPGPNGRRALRLFLGVFLFFVAMLGVVALVSSSLGQALERWLMMSPLALFGGLPFFVLVLATLVWRESVEAGPQGLTVSQRLPFPAT